MLYFETRERTQRRVYWSGRSNGETRERKDKRNAETIKMMLKNPIFDDKEEEWRVPVTFPRR